jgi:ribonuclease Y
MPSVTAKILGGAQEEAEKERQKAKKEADKLLDEAREEAMKLTDDARKEEQNRRKELKDLEKRLLGREETLDGKLDELDKRTEKKLRKNEDEVEKLKNEIRDIRTKQQEKLEKVAKLSKEEAADKLMQMTERDIRGDLLNLVNKLQNEARDNAEEQAALDPDDRHGAHVQRSYGRAHRYQRQAGRRRHEGPHHR